jgi:glycine oxidase
MSFDVAVLGGGIIGTCAAYELSKAGLNVVLLEKRHIASGASGTSAAMLEFQIDAHRGEPFCSLSKASNDLFPSLYDEVKQLTGMDFQFERCGIIQLASTQKDADFLKKEVARQKKMELKAHWYDKEMLQEKYPFLNPTHFGAALYEEDGQVNGERFVAAMAKAATLKGTVIHEDCGDIKLQVTNGKISGVATASKTYIAKKYVLAAGAWSDEVLAPLNMKLGVIPIRGQLVVYETPKNSISLPIYTRKSGYITPKQDGYTLVGTTVETVGFDETTTENGKQSIIAIAQQLAPIFSHKTIRGVTAGLRPGSPDGLPFLGVSSIDPNLIIATGHYRNGILLSPITAKIVTALVQDKKSPVDLTPFSPSRS